MHSSWSENKGKQFELMLELLRIQRYYECMVNCSPMSASQEMCILAGRIWKALDDMDDVK